MKVIQISSTQFLQQVPAGQDTLRENNHHSGSQAKVVSFQAPRMWVNVCSEDTRIFHPHVFDAQRDLACPGVSWKSLELDTFDHLMALDVMAKLASDIDYVLIWGLVRPLSSKNHERMVSRTSQADSEGRSGVDIQRS